MRLVVMMGLPGAGKDFWIKQKMPKADVVASADDFFMQDGVYKFDPKKLKEAHGSCVRKVVEALQAKTELVVVSNTNINITELSPYVALGEAYGAEVTIICLKIDPLTAEKRNVHGVGGPTLDRMWIALENTLDLRPARWDMTVFEWNEETGAYDLAPKGEEVLDA